MTVPTPSEAAQALAVLRRRANFACLVCGREFDGLDRPTQQPRTCSAKCRQQLYRDRKRQS